MLRNINFIIIPIFSYAINSYADIKANEPLYINCIEHVSSNTKSVCEVRQEPIENIITLNDRPDLKLHFSIDYSYTCDGARLTDIEVIGSDNESIGHFKYQGSHFENDGVGPLSVTDFFPAQTKLAVYGVGCQLMITNVEQDLSQTSISSLKKDICRMDDLVNYKAKTTLMYQLSQTLINNLKTASIEDLNSQLKYFSDHVLLIKLLTSDTLFKTQIDEVKAQSDNIIENDQKWSQDSLQKAVNSFYLTMTNLLYQLVLESDDSINKIYNFDKPVLSKTELKSTPSLLSNLEFEYALSKGSDTSIYTKISDCSKN